MNIAYSFKFALEVQTPVVPTEVKDGLAYFPGAVSMQRLSDGERQHIESRLRYQRACDSVDIISNGKPVTDGIDLEKTPVLAGVIDKMARLVGVRPDCVHMTTREGGQLHTSHSDKMKFDLRSSVHLGADVLLDGQADPTKSIGDFILSNGSLRQPLVMTMRSGDAYIATPKAVDGGEAFQVTTTDRVPPRTINARVRQSGDFTDGASLFRAPPEEQASAFHRLGKGRNPNGGRKLLPRRGGLTAEEWAHPSTEEQVEKKKRTEDNRGAGRNQTLGVGCGPGSDRNITGCVPSAGMDDYRTYVCTFHRWCEACKEKSPHESRFYVFQGIPVLNNGRATLALPRHSTTGGCSQMCLPCDKHGNIAVLATTYPAGDRFSGDRCKKLTRDHVAENTAQARDHVV
eukprot:g17285.t1